MARWNRTSWRRNVSGSPMEAKIFMSSGVTGIGGAGTFIAEGPPEAIRNDPRVIEAYLGDPKMTAQLMAE